MIITDACEVQTIQQDNEKFLTSPASPEDIFSKRAIIWKNDVRNTKFDPSCHVSCFVDITI